jgi:phosphoribosylaminoimidazolecarboxamide formyltransferase/IMP cyclohydrolase
MPGIKKALISVYDKRGLQEFASGLVKLGVELISTKGTADFLKRHGIKTREVGELTSFSELLEGKVKTLHPVVFAGILARRNGKEIQELAAHGISTIDMVVVNLYPFPEVAGRPEVAPEEVLTQLDVGGHALLRASIKNYKNVVIVVCPEDYERVLHELEKGELNKNTRFELALKAVDYICAYDQTVQAYFRGLLSKAGESLFPPVLYLVYRKLRELRYGENPHLKAALYSIDEGLTQAKQLSGIPLSFNNLADLDAGWSLVQEFEKPVAAIIKHQNPCGVACAETLREAFELARACDPVSAYGGVIALNRTLDPQTAEMVVSGFVEAVIAPEYEKEALDILKRKARLRVLETPGKEKRGLELKQISGGLLAQERDIARLDLTKLKFVTNRKPSEAELEDLSFAWRVVKYAKSNAIVLAKGQASVGIGAGQPSRVGAVELAINKAGEQAKGAALASDGFFPFPDSVQIAADAGVKAIIQPGGSIRDPEIVKAADDRGVAMVFTGLRCFKH